MGEGEKEKTSNRLQPCDEAILHPPVPSQASPQAKGEERVEGVGGFGVVKNRLVGMMMKCSVCGKGINKQDIHVIVTVANDGIRKYSRMYICEECLKRDILVSFDKISNERWYGISPQVVRSFWDFLRGSYLIKCWMWLERRSGVEVKNGSHN